MTTAHRQVVAVENGAGTAYGKATGLYIKYHNYSEQWNRWHLVRSAHDFQKAQSCSKQTKTWIAQHLRHGLDNSKIESFQSADAKRMILTEHDFRLGDDSWIENNSRIFGTLYYSDIWKCIQFLLAHLPFRHASILNQCALLTLTAVESTARWTTTIGGVIHKINFQPEQRLCQSFVHPTRLSWTIFWALSMPGRVI